MWNYRKLTKLSISLIFLWIWFFLQSIPAMIISSATFFLILLEKYFKIKIPVSFSFIFIFFVIFSLILWSKFNFYERFLWWDDLLHFLYWAWFAFIGFIIIQYLSIKKNIENEILLICLFSFCFSVAFGAIWEIYEFSIDSILWFNMQRTNIWSWVTDTMHDIILETWAALFTNISIYSYLKFWKSNWVSKLSQNFINLQKK